jgi:hypothetical protein
MSVDHLQTVCLDFDAVLHAYTSGWTGYTPEDDPEPGALEFVNQLLEEGYDLVIASARADSDLGREEIEKWLVKHGFPSLPVVRKVIAIAYVDDRAVAYEPGSQAWGSVTERIRALATRAAIYDR